MAKRKSKTQPVKSGAELRRFTTEFFSYFGAAVGEADAPSDGYLTVELGGDLAEHFGKPVLHLCFHNAEGVSGYDLVAHGSRTFDRMLAYLNGRGAATLLDLPSRHTSSEELLAAVRPLNASIANLRMSEQVRRLFVFNWRITYRSDDKREELYTVVLDEDGERLRLVGEPDAPAGALDLDALFADATEHANGADDSGGGHAANGQQAARPLPPMTHLVRLAEAARKIAIYHADFRCVTHEADVLPRLYRTLNRLTTYYGQQIEEVYDSHDPTGEKRRALEVDLERKIAEEVENHRLRVEVTLFSYAVFNLPVAVAEMTLSDGKREATVRVARNRYSGALERPRCHACGEETSAVAVDRNGHITCDNCIRQCAGCGEIVCAACGVAPCPVCGKENCEACGEVCWACGERACPEHISRCPVCGDTVCHACQAECAHCGTWQCRSHLHTDAVRTAEGEYQLICAACAVRCPGCLQYSASIETCEASGQRFCANCLVTCAKCGKRVGPGFYQVHSETGKAYCNSCMTECPACGALTPETSVCVTCGAVGCHSCGAACDVCGRWSCKEHVHRYEDCGHVVCAEHVAYCVGGGEEICALCHAGCAICGQPVCTEHTIICRRCGQGYCPGCIGKSGLCETCAGIAEWGEPVDMQQEPCAAHPSVTELARQFHWLRAENRRYVIYMGRSGLLSGAVVTVERSLRGGKVVAAHRLSLADMLRDRFAWTGD